MLHKELLIKLTRVKQNKYVLPLIAPEILFGGAFDSVVGLQRGFCPESRGDSR